MNTSRVLNLILSAMLLFVTTALARPADGKGPKVLNAPAPAAATAPSTTPGASGAVLGALAHPRMEVVFVLDTTGSMHAMIESAKAKIWAIARKLKAAQPTPEIRFGLVGYRDHGDAYVTKVHPLGCDIDATYEQLGAFTAAGGGDLPEAVNEALTAALHEIEWSADPGVFRAIFLVGDAPPQTGYTGDVEWVESCLEAKQRGILINTLQCGQAAATEEVWRMIAERSGGAYAALLDEGRTEAVATEYDAAILSGNRALDATIVPYGNTVQIANAAGNRLRLDSMSAEGVADRSSFLNRTEAFAVMSGKGDLIVELLAGRMTFDRIDPKLLDPSWAKLPVAERNAKIRRLMERRRELQAELNQLVEKREEVVTEQMEGAEDIIVLSPFEVLTEQAGANGYRFKK